MSNQEELEQIALNIKELDREMLEADKRFERFKQAAEKIKQNGEKFGELLATPLKDLEDIFGKQDFNHDSLKIFKDILSKHSPELSSLFDQFISPDKNKKPDDSIQKPVKKKKRLKINL
ncbi:hypothetical protein KAJ27_24555 [bacterium]|nr:hypothetical protein [bacterium]